MTKISRNIGLYMPLNYEPCFGFIRGALRYVEEDQDLAVRDFCFFKFDFDPPSPPLPPWTGRVDGVILYIPRTPATVEWVAKAGVPAVCASAEMIGTPVASVFMELRPLLQSAVGHLTGLGYRNFAYLGDSSSYGSQVRCAALAEELGERKLRLSSLEVREVFLGAFENFNSLEQADPQVVEFIKTAKRPLALIAVHGLHAASICRIVQWLGLRIPEDVAILSLNDHSMLYASNPPITAIRAPNEQVGYESARVLHRMIEGKRLARKVVQLRGAQLIVRQSTVGHQRNTRTNIETARELIRTRACEGLRVEDIAKNLCMSVRSLERQFAEAAGHSVGEEIRRVRMDHVKELLSNTDLSLARIASLVGYNGGNYLTNCFRRQFGQSPSEFRARNGRKKMPEPKQYGGSARLSATSRR